jgi:hypothetical protein
MIYNKDTNPDSRFIMYQTEDGLTKIDVHMEDETVWLSQEQMAELFQRDVSVISRHIKNVFSEGELPEKSNLQKMQIPNFKNIGLWPMSNHPCRTRLHKSA